MTTASTTFYEVVQFVHVFSAILAFGATYAYGFAFRVAERQDPRSMPTTLRWIHDFERYMLTPGLVVLLVTGLYMAIDLELFDQLFVHVGLAGVVLLGGLTGAYFWPRERRLIKLAERDLAAGGEQGAGFSDEFMGIYRQINAVGMLAGLLVAVIVFFMVAQP